MPNNNDVVIMIPVYNPDDKFITHLKNLKANAYNQIIVIDDGSRADTQHYFTTAVDEFGCELVVHNINLGQGRAYKSGFNYYLGKYSDTIGVIQCDCDGQHDIEDINRCAELLRKNTDKFILGARSFSRKVVPFRSYLGNKATSLIFKLLCGLDIDDTQTGLKGIPISFIRRIIATPGERFEYASSILLETKKAGIPILQFPIKTIYLNGNETSHFNPLLDSVRIYSLIFKFLLSSISAFVIDIAVYSICLGILHASFPDLYIIMSTYIAKVLSCSYTFFVNKKLVFNHQANPTWAAIQFVLLCIISSSISGFATNAFVGLTSWNEVVCKLIIDTLLFFVNFVIQNRVIFKNQARTIKTKE